MLLKYLILFMKTNVNLVLFIMKLKHISITGFFTVPAVCRRL